MGGAVAKILFLGPLNAIAVWAAIILTGEHLYWLLALLVIWKMAKSTAPCLSGERYMAPWDMLLSCKALLTWIMPHTRDRAKA